LDLLVRIRWPRLAVFLHRRDDGQYTVTIQEVYLVVRLHFVKPDNMFKIP